MVDERRVRCGRLKKGSKAECKRRNQGKKEVMKEGKSSRIEI